MMNYMLYKEAINPRQKKQVAGALGGGALGYLLTRYGLGVKGVGAGLTGAGMGATLGALGGDYLEDYEQQLKKNEIDIQEAKKRNRDLLDESVASTALRQAKSPYSYLPALGTGSVFGYRSGDAIETDLERRSKTIADKLTQATKGGDQSIKTKSIDPELATTVKERLKGSGKRSKELKLLEQMPRTGVGGSAAVRRGAVRGKRGLAYGLAAYLLAIGGKTTVERELYNPRREKFVNEGTK
jgi:hypothetical protein